MRARPSRCGALHHPKCEARPEKGEEIEADDDGIRLGRRRDEEHQGQDGHLQAQQADHKSTDVVELTFVFNCDDQHREKREESKQPLGEDHARNGFHRRTRA